MLKWMAVVLGASVFGSGAGAAWADDPPKTIITNPDWLQKPTFDQMMAIYPLNAFRQDLEGKATIRCIVTTSGLLRACTVVSETPPGNGFGEAALTLSTTFLMKPGTRNGAPVESEVTVPINFQTAKSSRRSAASSERTASRISGSENNRAVSVLREAAWDKAPTVPEILAEIDKKVGDRFADGQVVLQCSLTKKTGRLSNCITANVSPGMAQFQDVARSLTSKFQANPRALAEINTDDVRVNLAFSFPDMASPVWGQRYLSRPKWIRAPAVGPGQKLFPEEAAKAGIKSGLATVDCVVGPDGSLSQCAVISESTPGVGLGVMAVKIAEAFATNPWTDEGVPADGAHVRLPIKMVDAEADQGSPPTPATKP